MQKVFICFFNLNHLEPFRFSPSNYKANAMANVNKWFSSSSSRFNEGTMSNGQFKACWVQSYRSWNTNIYDEADIHYVTVWNNSFQKWRSCGDPISHLRIWLYYFVILHVYTHNIQLCISVDFMNLFKKYNCSRVHFGCIYYSQFQNNCRQILRVN